MTKRERLVLVGERNGQILTRFKPPIHEKRIIAATTGTLVIEKIFRDKDNLNKIRGVAYSSGDPDELEQNLAKLREDVEGALGYRVIEESEAATHEVTAAKTTGSAQ